MNPAVTLIIIGLLVVAARAVTMWSLGTRARSGARHPVQPDGDDLELGLTSRYVDDYEVIPPPLLPATPEPAPPTRWEHPTDVVCWHCKRVFTVAASALILDYVRGVWHRLAQCPQPCGAVVNDDIDITSADILRRFGAHVRREPADEVEQFLMRESS